MVAPHGVTVRFFHTGSGTVWHGTARCVAAPARCRSAPAPCSAICNAMHMDNFKSESGGGGAISSYAESRAVGLLHASIICHDGSGVKD